MSRRPVRFLTYALVAAALWLAFRNAQTPAQNPSTATDVERRLRALEDKLDKLTQLLAAREQPRPAEGTTARILTDAADRLRADLANKEKQLDEMRPKGVFQPALVNMYTERLAKIETRRAEFRLEKAEAEEKLAQIEKAYNEGGKSAAMEKISVLGVKSPAVDAVGKYEEEVLKLQLMKKKASATYSPNHPVMKEIDEQIELYKTLSGGNFGGIIVKDAPSPASPVDTPTKVMKALKGRIESLDRMLRMLDDMFKLDQAAAREIAAGAEKEKEKEKGLLADIDRARRALAAVEAALRDLDTPAK
jgi:hypothetical protein